MLHSHRIIEIRSLAKDDLEECLDRTDIGDDDQIRLVTTAPAFFAKKLGLSVVSVPSILRDHGDARHHSYAGKLDVRKKRIEISQEFPISTQKFTLGHELGHYQLHRDQKLLFRDREPRFGGHRGRPPQEEEADTYAAEMLMPSILVKQHFIAAFGGPKGCENLDALAYFVAQHAGWRFDARRFRSDNFYRAMTFARLPGYQGRALVPLVDRFEVSLSAMAWQLLSIGLVH
ncbi:ImmA/IrrE family metallo-endopeptidase [bacterium]|nr:ImmA/IrrE family metallo-endopeptidase [bacterium]